MQELFTAQNAVAFLTLTALEIVLGIDNVIFIAILSGKLPLEQQPRARQLGVGLAVISRLVLLILLYFLVNGEGLNRPFISPFGHGISVRDLVLLLGGMFLIGKSTYEIHEKLEGMSGGHAATKAVATMGAVLVQVMIVDLVFSLDSVLTAVGIADELAVMVPAILVAAAVMLLFANAIANFVETHPTFKILALAFLILIGSILVIEGWNPELAHELHIKNYAYFAMAFSVVIEVLNLRVRGSATAPVELHRPKMPGD